jgi:hypothetical protein
MRVVGRIIAGFLGMSGEQNTQRDRKRQPHCLTGTRGMT